MTCYRVNLFTIEPRAVHDWIEANIPEPMVIRALGYKVPDGWAMKCEFKRQKGAEAFHRHWYPDATNHSVSLWK
jgi:hypothetical protein